MVLQKFKTAPILSNATTYAYTSANTLHTNF